MASIFEIARRAFRSLPVVREARQRRAELAWAADTQRRVAQEAFSAGLLREDRYRNPRRLHQFEHQVFSQNGEDGAIREIFRRVGESDRTFLEMGVGTGQVNNTAFLLTQGWNGWWLDGDARSVALIRSHFAEPLAGGRLRLLQAFITAENAAECLRRLAVPSTVDLLSVDLDRNTYWILAALLEVVRPRVLVVEYNATYPPDVDWKVEYAPARWWNRTSYFGASLGAYEDLCRRHGLALVGCDLHGVNAYFVREDLCGDRFERPFTAATHYEPARYFLIRTHGHPPCFSDVPNAAVAGQGDSSENP